MLKNFPGADISVSIVWIQMPGFDDNETSARKIAGTFSDPRVRHFYDSFPAHFAGRAFAQGRVSRGPAWDIYFFFRKGQEWIDALPEPAAWTHQLSGGKRADPARFYSGDDLVDQLHEAMHRLTGEECGSQF